jgi:hypothetical protein
MKKKTIAVIAKNRQAFNRWCESTDLKSDTKYMYISNPSQVLEREYDEIIHTEGWWQNKESYSAVQNVKSKLKEFQRDSDLDYIKGLEKVSRRYEIAIYILGVLFFITAAFLIISITKK